MYPEVMATDIKRYRQSPWYKQRTQGQAESQKRQKYSRVQPGRSEKGEDRAERFVRRSSRTVKQPAHFKDFVLDVQGFAASEDLFVV